MLACAALAVGCGEPTGSAPGVSVEILSPAGGEPAYDLEMLLLLGTATSPTVGTLPDDSVWWTDNGEMIGRGPRFEIWPDQGPHRFVLRARYGTAEDSATRTITVQGGLARVLWTVPLEPRSFDDSDGLTMLADGRIVARHDTSGVVVIEPDGSTADRYETAFTLAQASPVALPDGSVLAGAWHGFPGGSGIGGLVQVTPAEPTVWTFDLGTQGTGFHHIHGGVAVDPGGTAYFVSGEHEAPFWAVDVGGTLRWRTETQPTDTGAGPENAGWTVLVGDSLAAAPLGGSFVAAVSTRDGSLRWINAGGPGNTWGRVMPAVGCGTIYTAGYDARGHLLTAIAPDGVVRWSVPVPGLPSNPVVGRSRVYLGWASGTVLAVSPVRVTLDTLGGEIIGGQSPGGTTLGAGDVLYVAGVDTLYSLTADGTRRFAIAIAIGGDGTWDVRPGPLIGVDGTVYLRTAGGVVALRDTVGAAADAPWPTAQGNFQRTGRVAIGGCTR